MIYFDWMEEKRHFGTIRQQIWYASEPCLQQKTLLTTHALLSRSALHFPLHLALVLAVEGMSQCIAWRAATQRSNDFDRTAASWRANLVPGISESDLQQLAQEVYNSTSKYVYSSMVTSPGIEDTLEYIATLNDAQNATKVMANGTQNFPAAEIAYEWMYQITHRAIRNIAGFTPPVNKTELEEYISQDLDFTDEHAIEYANEALGRIRPVFELTYVRWRRSGTWRGWNMLIVVIQVYFFTSIGLVVMICCVMATMSNRKKSQYHMARISLSGVIGLGLCLMATLDVNPRLRDNFTSSPWLIPMVTMSLFIGEY